MKRNSIWHPLFFFTIALAATAPVGALTAATALEDTNLALLEGQAREQLEQAQGEIDRAQQVVQLAQTALAGTLAGLDVADPADPPEPPEPPEPSEPPEPPELPVFNGLPDVGAIVDGALGQALAFGGSFSGGAGTPLIVAAELDSAQLGEFSEDLNVMGRILVKAANKATGGTKSRTAMGIKLQLPFGQASPSIFYLEPFGAVFFLSVNYPLVAPPSMGEPNAEPAKPTDTAWEEARAELYGGPERRRSSGVAIGGASAGSQMEYDASRVEALQSALLEAARNAANIRHLKPEDQVVVIVQGASQPGRKGVDARFEHRYGLRSSGAAKAAGRPTLLTIRFKKAEAEAVAQGKLSSEEFSKKASVWAR
jgi:hypothetical protein